MAVSQRPILLSAGNREHARAMAGIMDDSPAFATFTSELMQVARVVELILHAMAIGDASLAEQQGTRLRRQLGTLDHALRRLAPSELVTARALFAGLEQRLADAMLRKPHQLG